MPAIREHMVPTSYGTFHVEETGNGAPVLFLHGGTASAREWRTVLPVLGAHARCIAFDRLGCGASDRSVAGYDRDTVTRSLLACADALGLETFGVVGQSMGGFWALSLVAAAPDRVSHLVLVNSVGAPITEQERDAMRARMARSQNAERTQPPADPVLAREQELDCLVAFCFADPRRAPHSYRSDAVWHTERADPAQMAAVRSELQRKGQGSYEHITCPTLVIWGESDAAMPPERGKRLAEAIPGARFVGLPGCGHLCQVECPDAFINALAPFLDDMASGPRHPRGS